MVSKSKYVRGMEMENRTLIYDFNSMFKFRLVYVIVELSEEIFNGRGKL